MLARKKEEAYKEYKLLRRIKMDVIILDGKKYERRYKKWTENNIVVPDVLQKKLNLMLAGEADVESMSITKLIENADKFQDSRDYSLAIKYYSAAIARCVYVDRNNFAYILPRLSACYRGNGQPEKSIRLMKRAIEVEGNNILSVPMLTSVAAAYSDLKEWDKAKQYANRAYALSNGKPSQELINVYSRIKAEK